MDVCMYMPYTLQHLKLMFKCRRNVINNYPYNNKLAKMSKIFDKVTSASCYE